MTAYIHRLNAEWTTATRRVSPKLLIQWLDITGRELAEFFESLDPFGPAFFPVAWAGETASPQWFDIAREYTEKWHHTQQIFEAVAKPSMITCHRLMQPCLDTFLRALPFAYLDVQAKDGTEIVVSILGEAGGDWFLLRQGGRWRQTTAATQQPTVVVSLEQDSAWKLFTKRMDRQTALFRFPDIRFEGDQELGLYVLDMVSVMA